MAVTAVKGKSCTFTIGTTSFSAWVTSLEISGEKKAETVATGLLASFRGTLATAFFGIAFVVTGFLAAFNRISWAWVALVVVGAFLVFAGPAIVATSGNLASKTSTNGVADAADITFTAVTGDVSEALVIYKDTGVAATSPLLAFIDTATGLPVTPNGGNINVVFDNGTNKIFKL
jgi:type IV secretory pathway VirB2 component (pilin)